MFLQRYFIVLGLCMYPCICLYGSSAPELVQLENDSIRLSLDTRSLSITQLFNKLSGETLRIQDKGFSVEVGTEKSIASVGVLTPRNCLLQRVEREPSLISFFLKHGLVSLVLRYRLDPGDHFAVKTLEMRYEGQEPYNVHRLILFDWKVLPSVEKTIRYWGVTGWSTIETGREWIQKPDAMAEGRDWVQLPDVQPQRSDNSIAYFMRNKRGGVFLAISCDFFTMEDRGETCRLAYWPGYILPPDKKFSSEKGLIGVYARKGLFKPSQYSLRDLGDFFFPQYVRGELDRGEWQAVYDCVRKYLKPAPYKNWVNTWTLGFPWDLDSPEAVAAALAAVDTMARLKSVDALPIQPPWLGLYRRFPETGTKTPIQPSPYVQQVLDYMHSKGIKPLGVAHPGTNFPDSRLAFADKPGWSILAANGERNNTKIAICREYVDYMWSLMETLIPKGHLGGWLYDILWFFKDYDTSHGYLPGVASLYPQWRNLLDLNLKLQETFPDFFLGGWVGWIEHGPWFQQGLAVAHNGHDHFIDLHVNFHSFHPDHMVANNIRLSNYLGHMTKMLPMTVSNATVGHYKFDMPSWDRLGYQFSLLSNIATSRAPGHLTIIPDEKAGEAFLPEERQFIDKWLRWARDHESYYGYDTLLFGEPSWDGVDGYAYCKPSDGIFFLCNSGNDSRLVAVPVGKEIRLQASGPFLIKELYPLERYRIGPDDGLFSQGSSFLVRVPGQTVMVFEVRPYKPGERVLLGVPGTIAGVQNGEVLVEGVRGEAGTKSWVAVKGIDAPAPRLRINGKSIPATVQHELLMTRVRFEGEPADPELAWRATRNGESLTLRTEFYLPALAREILASQQYPMRQDARSEEVRRTAPWIDSSRLIISLPFRNSDAFPLKDISPEAALTDRDGSAGFQKRSASPGYWIQFSWAGIHEIATLEIQGKGLKKLSFLIFENGQWIEVGTLNSTNEKAEALKHSFTKAVQASELRILVNEVYGERASLNGISAQARTGTISATFNGQELKVERNMMKSRCAGFYLEPKSAAVYGGTNRLELVVTGIQEGDVITPRLENLVPYYTTRCEASETPARWPFSSAPEAQDPFDPVPEVRLQGSRAKALLQIDFSSHRFQRWDGGLHLDSGQVDSITGIGMSAGWGDRVDAAARQWKISTDNNTKKLRVFLEGGLDSNLTIRVGESHVEHSLRELLHPIVDADDPWHTKVLSLPIGDGTLSISVLALPRTKLKLDD